MRNQIRKSALCICLVVILMIGVCSCGAGSEEITYKSVSICDVELQIPATYTAVRDDELYKEFASEDNSDLVCFCYMDDADYEEMKEEAWDALYQASQKQKSFKDINQYEYEANGLKGHRIEYVEHEYSCVLTLIPFDEGVLYISTYIEDDDISEYVLKSIQLK